MRILLLLISAAFFAVLAAAYAAARNFIHDDGLEPTGKIPLGEIEGRIDHMAADLDGSQLFVAALGSDMVEKVDSRQGRVVAKIPGINEPQGLGYIPESKRLAVASGGDGSVRIYDEDLKLVGRVNSLEDADNVRYDTARQLLYVGYGRGALALIDPARSVKIAEIPLDGHPESFQLERRGNRIFVNIPTAEEIEVLDREKRIVLARWKLTVAAGNFPMALDETNQRLFVGCRRPARLLVLNTESGQVVANLKACGDTDDLFYDTTDAKIYLSGGSGCVSIFNATNPANYREFRTIATASGARTSLFEPNTRRLYVAVPHRGSQRAEILIFNESE
jgi:DNA-binding beta-propeller fold protein YncE